MGFEGNSKEINLKRHAKKTRTACRQDTEYLVMFHGREESVKSTNGAHDKPMSTDSSPKLQHAAWQDGGTGLFLLLRHRLRTPSSARSDPVQCRRQKTVRSMVGLSWFLKRSSFSFSADGRLDPQVQFLPIADSAHSGSAYADRRLVALRFSSCRSQTRRTQVQLLPIAD